MGPGVPPPPPPAHRPPPPPSYGEQQHTFDKDTYTKGIMRNADTHRKKYALAAAAARRVSVAVLCAVSRKHRYFSALREGTVSPEELDKLYKKALRVYKQVIDLDPSNALAVYQSAVILKKRGEKERAAEVCVCPILRHCSE
jgi:tetratricopeptide (TPR) repeat protein